MSRPESKADSSARKAFVQSFGCRASQSDGAAIEESLRSAGFEVTRQADGADLVVINTCTVTNAADVDARRLIRGTHRDHSGAQILVTGCYAQRAPAEIAGIPGVTWVVGNSEKGHIAEIAGQPRHEEFHGEIVHTVFGRDADFLVAPVRDIREDRARPNLKIQDGCNNRCSFCIIPSVRGPSRSASLALVVDQIRGLSERYPEIVLTGINLGRWGRDLAGRPRLPELLKSLLSKTSVQRLRLSSVEPMDWTDELLEVVASEPRIAPHVHMPLQSGSDTVLKRMYRRYRTRHYANRIEAAYRLMPDAAFGADVMTGFPGESDAEFAETVAFLEKLPFTYLHVFTYSERPGTIAAAARESIPVSVRRERTSILREVSGRKNLAFRQRMVGRTVSAVTLEQPGMALSENYLRIRMAEWRPPQKLVALTLDRLTGDGLAERTLFPVLPRTTEEG